MFPLGSVLVPSAGLPLHVFEERYRRMVRDCLAADEQFGVVLIERGSEVGGADVRSRVGTIARIVEAVELDDGRWAVGAVGVRRLRVVAWLADDPYPRAEVEPWDDPPVEPGHAAEVEAAVVLLRRALALAAEVGDPAAPATIELASDPVVAGYQAIAVAPIGPLDQQRLLSAPSAEVRISELVGMLHDEIEVLGFRLGSPPGEV
jgi:Lon protease-like protein